MDLSKSQKEAVLHKTGPLLVTAGAGSGKTRTLTERVIKLIESGVAPEKIVAITFTNKAANEMRERIVVRTKKKKRLPFIGTFHAFSSRILRAEAKHAGRDSNYVIFDDKDSLKVMKKVVRALDLPKDKKLSPTTLRKEISRAKSKLLRKEDLEEPISYVFEDYEKRLSNQNAFDFDDLIEKAVRVFAENPNILQKHASRYEYILVDEYQDINHMQYILVSMLSRGHKNLTVVGDDQQSIYAFRGANIRTFLDFEKDWPGTKIVHLGQNYRSTSNIVSAAAGVISNNNFQIQKKLWSDNEEGDPVKVIGARSAEDEADVIANLITVRGLRESAILYRTNAQSRALEQALNFASIPYEIFGGVKFYERKEVKDIVAPLRYALNPKDEISKERIQKTFLKAQREELVKTLPKLAKELSLMELIGYVLKTTNYFERLAKKFENSEDRAENVRELVNFASEFDSLKEFIERVTLLQANDRINKRGQGDAPVKLMTIHLAKGLEFDDVYIAGANEGMLPHHRSFFSEEELEEERRLMYVAMTRARKSLILSFYSLASRFLYEIPPQLVEFKTIDQLEDDEVYIDYE